MSLIACRIETVSIFQYADKYATGAETNLKPFQVVLVFCFSFISMSEGSRVLHTDLNHWQNYAVSSQV